jgi:hypothetical protein
MGLSHFRDARITNLLNLPYHGYLKWCWSNGLSKHQVLHPAFQIATAQPMSGA